MEEELKKDTKSAESEEAFTASVEEIQKQTEAEMSNPYNTSLSQFLTLEQSKMDTAKKLEDEKEIQRILTSRTLSEEIELSTETDDAYPSSNTTSESEGKEPMTTSPTTAKGEFEFTMDEDEDYDDEILTKSPIQKAVPFTLPDKPQAASEKICFLVDSDDEEDEPVVVDELEETKTIEEVSEVAPEEEEIKLPSPEEEKKQEPMPMTEQEP